jgi:hypothetical protein
MIRLLRNVGWMFASLVYYAFINRSVFPLAMIVLFMIIAAFAAATQVAVPFIYTVF